MAGVKRASVKSEVPPGFWHLITLAFLGVGRLRGRGPSLRQTVGRTPGPLSDPQVARRLWGYSLAPNQRSTSESPTLARPSPLAQDSLRYTTESSHIPSDCARNGRSFPPAETLSQLSPAPC